MKLTDRMTRRWTVKLSLLLLGVLASGCGQNLGMCWSVCPGEGGPGTPDPIISEFLGMWVNEDPQLGQIIRLEIFREGRLNFVHSWEGCDSTDCDLQKWGTALEVENEQRVLLTFRVRQEQNHNIEIKLRKASAERLEAVTTTYFNSVGRDPEEDTYYFVK